MAAVGPNLEEAANVATEFIYSLDNLPHEVAHILQEIKHRETRTIELQQEIDKDAARYIRHSRRASSASTPMPMTTMSTSPTKSTTPVPESPSLSPSRSESVAPGNGMPVAIPTKISASYNEIHVLAAEKVALAEKLIELITRTRAKLDVDILKVRLLQGESPELVAAQVSASLNLKPAGLMALTGMAGAGAGAGAGAVSSGSSGVGDVESFGAPGRNPALAISESLRNAMATQPSAEGRSGVATVSSSSVGSPSASGHPNKKRRTTITTSIKITPAASPTKRRSSSPASVAPAHGHAQQKSRLSRQVHPPPREEEDDDDMDADGEGEEEDPEVEDDNDETLYCFCQKQSYGDMIACDNEGGCPYEWFHLACVGLKQPPAEKWYCSVCAKDKGLTSTVTTSSRKGRRK